MPRSTTLSRYMAQIRHCAPLPAEESDRLVRRYRETGDATAARVLIERNLPLVVSFARKFAHDEERRLDLIQEGSEALVWALHRYDPDGGAGFSGYARHIVRGRMLRHVLFSGPAVRLCLPERQMFFRLRRARRAAEADGATGAEVSRRMAERLSLPVSTIEEMRWRTERTDASLDAPIRGLRRALGDLLPDAALLPDEVAAREEFCATIRQAVAQHEATLRPREVAILRRRWIDEEPARLEDLAVEFNVSREAIRQSEQKVLQQLRRRLTLALGEDAPQYNPSGMRRCVMAPREQRRAA